MPIVPRKNEKISAEAAEVVPRPTLLRERNPRRHMRYGDSAAPVVAGAETSFR
jgi:hypothetical protein